MNNSLPSPHLGYIPSLVLCDLDGTLGDSLSALYAVYQNFLTSFGYQATQEEFQQLIGPSISEVVETLQQKYQMTEPLSVLCHRYGLLMKFHLERIPLMPGAEEFLQKGLEEGSRFFLVTSATRAYAERFIGSHRLQHCFEGIVAAEDVPIRKPHPAPYLKALHLAKVPAEKAIAIEDSSSGVASASTAGLKTFWLTANGAGTAESIQWQEGVCKVKSWPLIKALVYSSA